MLIEIKYDKIELDWEAREYRWIRLDEIDNFEFAPGFEKVIDNLFKI